MFSPDCFTKSQVLGKGYSYRPDLDCCHQKAWASLTSSERTITCSTQPERSSLLYHSNHHVYSLTDGISSVYGQCLLRWSSRCETDLQSHAQIAFHGRLSKSLFHAQLRHGWFHLPPSRFNQILRQVYVQPHGLHHDIPILHYFCREDMKTNQELVNLVAHMLQEERRV